MQPKIHHWHAASYAWHRVLLEGMWITSLALFVFIFAPTSQAMRFQERSLYMNDTTPGEIASYTVSFRYMSPEAVGSLDLLFCVDPIPYHPCVTPAGLDVSGAVLSSQLGEAGFSVQSQTTNRIILTRAPSMITSSGSSAYVFDNIVNPLSPDQAFAIRLKSHASVNATGPQIDFGSVRGQVTRDIEIETQVPPMLIFCVAEQVADNCASTNDNYYSDMGELSPSSTLTAQSQMAVGTNASGGFSITANGPSLSAGTSVINALSEPQQSRPGTNQFGINLVANNEPQIGTDPEGTWANAVPATEYSQSNQFKYAPGDVVAFSPNVSLMKKFTVSYIVNSAEQLRPGVYTTTITYIASGRF